MLECPGQGTCAIQIAGTWAGTLVFEVSLTKDDWTALSVSPSDSSAAVTGTTANGLWSGAVAGMQAVRVRCSVYASGIVGVQLQAVPSSGVSALVGIANGANVVEGAIADVAVVGDNTGTLSAKLRGVDKILADVWDSVNHWFKVSIQNASIAVTGTFWQTTQPTSVADGQDATLGAKTDAKSTATDGTSTSVVSILKEISAMEQAPASRAVTNAGTFPVQAAATVGDGANVVEGATTGAKVITDANGTIQGYLRGLVYLLITSGQALMTASGDVASGATDSGNPIKIGGKAASAAPSAVTAAQRVNTLFDLWGRQHVRDGHQAPVASTFTGTHVPATNAQATATKASAGSGKRNVCTGFTVTLCAGASAPTAAAPITVAVIDGATGGTTYLWRTNINLPAVAGAQISIVRTGLWLVGSQATALTVEFSAAGGTNTYESVALDGVIVEE